MGYKSAKQTGIHTGRGVKTPKTISREAPHKMGGMAGYDGSTASSMAVKAGKRAGHLKGSTPSRSRSG